MEFAKQTNLLVLTPNPKGRGPLKLSHFLAVCVPNDSDPNFQKSYQILTTFFGEILPNSDSKF